MTTVFDQSGFVTNQDVSNITQFVSADNFTIGSPETVNGAVVYLNETSNTNNGTLDQFSGTIGWAIYQDNGSGKPGTLVASGTDSSPKLTDTGQDLASDGTDVIKAEIDFGNNVDLPPGNYWLAIHEGAWGSPSDGTVIWWVYSGSGQAPIGVADTNLANPTAWTTSAGSNLAFALVLNNRAPTFTTAAALSADENQTAVASIAADDSENDALTFSITGTAEDNALFSITSDGILTFKAAPDFENPNDFDDDGDYEVEVTVDDGQGNTVAQTFTVTVDNVNEDPAITSDGGGSTAALSLRENRTQVTTVIADDPDAKTVIAYSISGGADGALFDIDPDTGVLTFKAAPDFENPADANGDNTYVVKVTADDGDGGTDSQTLSITITNGNDRPIITSDGGKLRASVDVAENSTAVTKVQASDQDGSSITYAISGGDDKALFSIDATTGKVDFKAAPDFEEPQDKNRDNSYQITVRATDSDGAIDVQYLTINVTNVGGVTINGSSDADVINGKSSAPGQPLPTSEEDVISGSGGKDRISGLGGNDLIEGGALKDILKGGAGRDNFFYASAEASNAVTGIDVIKDFTQGDDIIDLGSFDADGAGGHFHFLGEAAFDGEAGALRQRTDGDNVFLEGDTDGDGTADFAIMLKGAAGLVLTDSDLFLGLTV